MPLAKSFTASLPPLIEHSFSGLIVTTEFPAALMPNWFVEVIVTVLLIGLVGLIGYRITKNSDAKGPKEKVKDGIIKLAQITNSPIIPLVWSTKKFKIINSIVPISIALFSNSSIVEKKNSGFSSYRSKVWQETSRGGLPEVFFDNMDFEKYADFSINFPLLFIQNEKEYLSGSNYSFSDFMNGKINEINNRLPTEDDLTTHLSTIFTENRLKKYIELRSMDTCGWDCLCSGPAFNTGILYGNLDEAYELISKWDKNKIINAYLEAPKKGFNTELMGKDLLHWSSLLLGISRKGLLNRDILSKSNDNETKFLNHLDKLIDNKTTNADHMIDKFSKNENLNDLYDK